MRIGCAYKTDSKSHFQMQKKVYFIPTHVFLVFKTNKAMGTLEHSGKQGCITEYQTQRGAISDLWRTWSSVHLGVCPRELGGVQWQTGIFEREINSAERITSWCGSYLHSHTCVSDWDSYTSFYILIGFVSLRFCHIYNMKQQLLFHFTSIVNKSGKVFTRLSNGP